MATLKAKIKGGMSSVPVFGSNQPVVVNIKFFMRRPNTHFKGKDRQNALRAGMPLAHVVVPDLDNMVKFVLDGMNKLVYQGDKQWGASWLHASCLILREIAMDAQLSRLPSSTRNKSVRCEGVRCQE